MEGMIASLKPYFEEGEWPPQDLYGLRQKIVNRMRRKIRLWTSTRTVVRVNGQYRLSECSTTSSSIKENDVAGLTEKILSTLSRNEQREVCRRVLSVIGSCESDVIRDRMSIHEITI